MKRRATGLAAADRPPASGRSALITGGAGFIGSTLADRLLNEGWSVTVVDNFDPFYPKEQKRRHVAAASGHPAYRLIETDIREGGAIGSAVLAAQPTVVFHLAARAGVRPSIRDPEGYVTTNVLGTQHVLSAAAAVHARVVFASSSSVYGADPRQPFVEDQAGMGALSPYGATKTAGEALAHAHHVATGLPVGVARLFTVYGPRQRPDLAIRTFARNIVSGRPVELYDHGRGVRDYTYVDDTVDALVRLSRAADAFLTVNIGSHDPVITADMVTLLEDALGRSARRVLLPAQPGDVPATFADVSRAREHLGWAPKTSLADGIGRFCEWILDELEDRVE